MDEKKKYKKSRKNGQNFFCLESVWDALGAFFGVQIAQKKIFWALGYEKQKKISESHGSVTDRFVLILLRFLKHF